MKYLITGLGNIGPEYELTRHNAGFLCLDQLADKHNAKFEVDRYAFKSEFKQKGRHIHIIKPTTFMNVSGKAVRYWLEKLKIPVSRLLVVVDDVALPFGTIRIRAGGSAAGHNGLINIETLLNTRDYPRLRIGIGDNFPKGRQVEYVLSRFSNQEIKDLPAVFDKACDAIEAFSSIGLERTMNFFNKK